MKTRRIYIENISTNTGCCGSVPKETTPVQSSCCGTESKQEETLKVSTCS